MENGKVFGTISELPSGKRLHNELEHHHAFFMGKLTISRGIFYVANCKRLPGRVANIQEMPPKRWSQWIEGVSVKCGSIAS